MSDPPRSAGALTSHTDLLGDLPVPGGGEHTARLEALAARAALHAPRAGGPDTRRICRSAWRGFEA